MRPTLVTANPEEVMRPISPVRYRATHSAREAAISRTLSPAEFKKREQLVGAVVHQDPSLEFAASLISRPGS